MKIKICITVDMEQDIPPIMQTYKGIEIGIPYLLNIFKTYKVKATFFATGNIADKYPKIISEIINRGHEIGCHGMWHEDLSASNYQDKSNRISEATRIIEDIVGEKIVSFRAPYHLINAELLSVLESHGYLIEASKFQKSEVRSQKSDMPYYPNNMKILRVPLSLPPASYFPLLTSRFLLSLYNMSWILGYKYAVFKQRREKIKVIILGSHSWEFVDIPESPENYRKIYGKHSRDKLNELFKYLNPSADGKNVEFITIKELLKYDF